MTIVLVATAIVVIGSIIWDATEPSRIDRRLDKERRKRYGN